MDSLHGIQLAPRNVAAKIQLSEDERCLDSSVALVTHAYSTFFHFSVVQ